MRRLGLESKPVLQWPEFNTLIGGYFKFHWPDPQLIYVKIDDPNSPLTAMFHGKEFEIHDETYTFEQESFSRRNVHVLTSIDYDKMSAEDKAKEAHPRTDADYALSYIRREGNGRVFYEGHGHSDRVYAYDADAGAPSSRDSIRTWRPESGRQPLSEIGCPLQLNQGKTRLHLIGARRGYAGRNKSNAELCACPHANSFLLQGCQSASLRRLLNN